MVGSRRGSPELDVGHVQRTTATLPAIRGRRGALTATDRRHVSGAESRRYRDRGNGSLSFVGRRTRPLSQAITPGAGEHRGSDRQRQGSAGGVSQAKAFGRLASRQRAPGQPRAPVTLPYPTGSGGFAITPAANPRVRVLPRTRRAVSGFKSAASAVQLFPNCIAIPIFPSVAIPTTRLPIDPPPFPLASDEGTFFRHGNPKHRATSHPMPFLLASDEGTFHRKGRSILAAAHHPMPFLLASDEGTFRSPRRVTHHPMPFLLASDVGAFNDSPIRDAMNPMPFRLAPDASACMLRSLRPSPLRESFVVKTLFRLRARSDGQRNQRHRQHAPKIALHRFPPFRRERRQDNQSFTAASAAGTKLTGTEPGRVRTGQG